LIEDILIHPEEAIDYKCLVLFITSCIFHVTYNLQHFVRIKSFFNMLFFHWTDLLCKSSDDILDFHQACYSCSLLFIENSIMYRLQSSKHLPYI
jgi:hypothetical protein